MAGKQKNTNDYLDYYMLKPLFSKYSRVRDDDEDDAFYFETDDLMVGVFSHVYPNTGYNGKVLAEHKNNFDKRSKAFYSSDLPSNKKEIDIIVCDLEYISSKENEEAGDAFSTLHRTFL